MFEGTGLGLSKVVLFQLPNLHSEKENREMTDSLLILQSEFEFEFEFNHFYGIEATAPHPQLSSGQFSPDPDSGFWIPDSGLGCGGGRRTAALVLIQIRVHSAAAPDLVWARSSGAPLQRALAALGRPGDPQWGQLIDVYGTPLNFDNNKI